MNRRDFNAFVSMLAAEVEIRGGKPLSQAAIGLWWERMERYDLSQVKQAFELYAREENGRFMPQPSDLIRHVEGTSSDRAALAWGLVLRGIGAAGAYQHVDFGDPAIHAAIHDLGGWPKVCRTELKEIGFVQKRFCDAFKAYQARGVVDCPLVLAGDCDPDVEYEKRGLPAPKAVLLGARRCADVMRGLPALAHTARAALELRP